MKKKLIFIGIIILLILVLSGCEDINIPGINFGTQKFNPDVHKGNQGLIIEILDNSPPNSLYEDENFKVVTKLINKGAYTINNGILTLNYEKEFIDLQGDRKKRFSLEGKDIYNLWDDEKVISYDMKTKLLDKMSKKHTSLILLTACYDYETIASYQVCIDTNIYKTRPEEEKVCTVKDLTSSGQGGPLIVSRVEEDISGGEFIIPMFKIYIENVGNGNVIKYGKKEEVCGSKGISVEDYNVVDLVDVELSNYKLSKGEIKCSPGEIKLKNGGGLISCHLDVNRIKSTDSSFVTSLKIYLKYGYSFTESRYIDILDDISKEGRDMSIESSTEKIGIKQTHHCYEPFSNSYCYDLSNGKVCPKGLIDTSGYCPGNENIRCCVYTKVP